MNYSICSRKTIKAKRVKLKPYGLTYLMYLNRTVDKVIMDAEKMQKNSA